MKLGIDQNTKNEESDIGEDELDLLEESDDGQDDEPSGKMCIRDRDRSLNQTARDQMLCTEARHSQK